MIATTDNYFADLQTAINSGLFPTGAKPKKASLYEAIAQYNTEFQDFIQRAEEPADQLEAEVVAEPVEATKQWAMPFEWVLIHTFERPLRSDGERAWRVDADSDFHSKFTELQAEYPNYETRGDVHSQIEFWAYIRSIKQVEVPVSQLEAEGKEAELQARLLEMDAAEDAQKAQQPEATAQRKERTGSPSPEARLEQLELIHCDVAERGLKAIAELMGTSTGRLSKMVKAYAVLRDHDSIRAAFLAGKVKYSALCELAVRRDGVERLTGLISA